MRVCVVVVLYANEPCAPEDTARLQYPLQPLYPQREAWLCPRACFGRVVKRKTSTCLASIAFWSSGPHALTYRGDTKRKCQIHVKL